MKKQNSWFLKGALIGGVTLSLALASVPKMKITDDTALYQSISEIKVAKEPEVDFDRDLDLLARAEQRYHNRKAPVGYRVETARSGKLVSPIERVSRQQYHYVGQSVQQPRAIRD